MLLGANDGRMTGISLELSRRGSQWCRRRISVTKSQMDDGGGEASSAEAARTER